MNNLAAEIEYINNPRYKESAKILAQHSVDLGFYPSNKFSLYKTEFINLKAANGISYLSIIA